MDRGSKDLTRRRSELARAFNEFKRSNPTATMQEFQWFIDQNVGTGPGSNYVRGGAPSQEVLQSIVAENKRREMEEVARQKFDQFRREQEMLGSFEGVADQLIFQNMDNPDKAYEEFRQRISPEALDYLGPQFNALSLFAPSRIETIKNQRIQEALPRAIELIEQSDGKIDRQQMSNLLGVPMTIVDPIIERAQKSYDMKMEDRNRQLQSDALRASNDVRNWIWSDRNLDAYITSNDSKAAKELMLQEAKQRMTDEQFEIAYGVAKNRATPELFDSMYNERLATLRYSQRNAFNEALTGARASVYDAQMRARSDNLDEVRNHFGDPSSFVKSTTGRAGGTGAIVAAMLTDKYQLGPAAFQAITNAFEQAPDEILGDHMQLSRFVESTPEFQSAVYGMDRGSVNESIRSRVESQTVGSQSLMTFNDFVEEKSADLAAAQEQTLDIVQKIAQTDMPPEEKIIRYQGIIASIGREFADEVQQWGGASKNRTWLIYGEDTWNDDRVFNRNNPSSLLSTLLSAKEELISKIQREIEIEAASAQRIQSQQRPNFPQQDRRPASRPSSYYSGRPL